MLCSWRTGSRTWFQTGSDGTPVKRKAFCYRDGFLARDLALSLSLSLERAASSMPVPPRDMKQQ
jgi:hypothetical protein